MKASIRKRNKAAKAAEANKTADNSGLTWHREEGCYVARGNMVLYKVEKVGSVWVADVINQFARVVATETVSSMNEAKNWSGEYERGGK